MQYITIAERIGIQKGIEQGRIKGELEVLNHQIQRKFKQLPGIYRQCLEKSDANALLKLADRILEAQKNSALRKLDLSHNPINVQALQR